MRDNHFEIRKEYFDAIDGNITLSASNVPILDTLDADQTNPYIYFQEYTAIDDSDKTSHATTVTMGLVVNTKYEAAFGGSKDSDTITNQLLQILLPDDRTTYFTSTNFRIVTAKLLASNIVKTNSRGGMIVKRIIRIEHYIEQTTTG